MFFFIKSLSYFLLLGFWKIIVKKSTIYINFIVFKVIAHLNHTLVYNLNLTIFIAEHGRICEKE